METITNQKLSNIQTINIISLLFTVVLIWIYFIWGFKTSFIILLMIGWSGVFVITLFLWIKNR